MTSVLTLTQQMIQRALRKHAAAQPRVAHYDSRGRRDTAETSGVIIGSRTPVDCSYCVEATDVTFTPPDMTPDPV